MKYEVLSGIFTFSRDAKKIFVDTFYEIHKNASIDTINRLENTVNNGIENFDSYYYLQQTEENKQSKMKVYFTDETLAVCIAKYECFEPIVISEEEFEDFILTF